jgi:predicted nucleic acid-binding protein
MTRFGIDTQVAIQLVRDKTPLHPDHQLVAPSVLRSRVLSVLYAEVRRGGLDEKEARTILDGVTSMRVRLLGDRVSRAWAWDIARTLDSDDTLRAEFIAVAKLQADALVSFDTELVRQAEGIVPLASFDAFTEPSATVPR